MREHNMGKAAEHYKEISLRDVIAPFFRRKRFILITFVTIFVAIILLALLMGPVYSSHTEILLNRERQDPLVTSEATTQLVTNSVPVTEEEINSEIELLRSRDVLEKVVLENGLQKQHGFSLIALLEPKPTEADLVAKAVKHLAKKLKITAVAKTNLIDIEYSSANPQLAYSVVRSLADAYLVKHVSVHRPNGSYDFFSKETDKYHDELKASESRLRDFSEKTGVAAPDVQRTNLALEVATSIGLLHQAQQAGAADEERIRDDRQQMGNTPERSATIRSSAEADKLLDSLNASLLSAQARRDQLAMKYEPTYPAVQEADQEIAQAKAAIADAEKTKYTTESTDRDPTYELLREDLAKTNADLAAQRASAAATQRSINSMQAKMVDLDRQALTQQDLLRDAKANETNYLLYLSKREQERTSDALDTERIGNVAIAVPPAIPVLPVFSWPMIIVFAFGAAMVLSVGSAYVIDYLDPSFHTPAQVVDMLGIPVVIAVPKKGTRDIA